MLSPQETAAEYKRLWTDTPLRTEEIQQINETIDRLDKLLDGNFMEDPYLLNARIMLAHVVDRED